MKCPNCNSEKISQEYKLFSENKNEGISYLNSVLNNFYTINNFKNDNQEFYCESCGIGFLYPWLSNTDRNKVYVVDRNLHNAGWVSLENAISANNRLKLQEASFNFLSKAIDIIKIKDISKINYAELNCPFSGPVLFYWSKMNNYKSKIKIYSESLNNGNRPTISMKIQFLFFKASNFISRKILSLRNYRNKNKKISKINIFDFLNTPDLIISPSSCFWTSNCVSSNKSCVGLANSFLFNNIFYINNLTKSKNYDIIFAANVLDHTDKPSKIIDDLLDISNNIIIQTHTRNSIGYQHLFALSNTFFITLNKKYKVINLGEIFTANNYSENAYLISHYAK